jgi:hypothetical protein
MSLETEVSATIDEDLRFFHGVTHCFLGLFKYRKVHAENAKHPELALSGSGLIASIPNVSGS